MLHRIPVFPRYPKKAHASGQARIRVNGRDYYLGKHGSPESRQEYARLAQEFACTMPGSSPVIRTSESRISIAKLILLWHESAVDSQIDATTVTGVLLACAPLERLYGATYAADFDAKKLREVRKSMISGAWMTQEEKEVRRRRNKPCEWARSYTNKSVSKILRVFRWAESEGLIPAGKSEHLRTLERIPPSARVRTTEGRQTVDFDSQVKPCLRFMPPQVAAMVQAQYLIGSRPSEICSMRRCELDMETYDGVWLYVPEKHKNEWRGDELIKVIGPRAQKIIAPWVMSADEEDYVFPPLRNRATRGCYDSASYYQAIRKAAIHAKVKRWKPYDMRHTAGDNAEAVGGIEGASAVLGHRDMQTTKIYLGKQNLAKAIEIAQEIG